MTERETHQKSTENFALSDRPLDPSMRHPILVLWDSSHGSEDPLGTTTELSGISGTRAKRFRTDPWGNQIQGSRSAKHDPFRFVGGYGVRWEPEVGLHHMGARWYDPQVGRFTGRDPVWGSSHQSQLLNRYGYVANNPVTNVDPSGNAFFTPQGLVMIGGAAWVAGCAYYAIKVVGLERLPQRYPGQIDRFQHCVSACTFNRCMLLHAPVPTMAGELFWEIRSQFQPSFQEAIGDIQATAEGIGASYLPGSCEKHCRCWLGR